MTLDERIAKRKAEGWRLAGFRKRRDDGVDDGAYLYDVEYVMGSNKNGRSLSTGVPGRFVPVFTRTIRTKRGHGFGWALARMKEGKTVRRPGKVDLLAIREGHLVDFYENTKVFLLSSEYIEANNWELAE